MPDQPSGCVFEWDSNKARSNFRKHGISFEEASTVFGDPLALLMPDPDHSLDEERHVLLEMSNRRKLMVVSFAGTSAIDAIDFG